MDTNRLVGADYVAEALGISKPSAYRIIRSLNAELQAAGKRTISGRVSLSYLEKRFFEIPGEVAK